MSDASSTVNDVEENQCLEAEVPVDVNAAENSIGLTKRIPSMTEKGRQYHIDASIKTHNQNIRRFKRCLKDLALHIVVSVRSETIKDAVKALYDASNKAEESLYAMDCLLNRESFGLLENEYKDLENQQREKIAQAEEALRENSLIDRQSRTSSYDISKLTQSPKRTATESNKSVRSVTSSKTIESLRLERAHKLEEAAALKTQLSYHKAQSDLKQKRAALEDEEKRLQIECQIATLEASVKASREAEILENCSMHSEILANVAKESIADKHNRILQSMNNSVVSVPGVKQAALELAVERDDNPEETKVRCYNKDYDVSTSITKLKMSEGMTDKLSKPSKVPVDTLPNNLLACQSTPIISYRIPDVKIDTFVGNVVDFPAWEIAFDAIIDGQVKSTDLKINLLSQHLSGEAKNAVSGLLTNRTEDSYLAARRRLKERYGNPNILCQAFLNKLEDWSVIKPHQPKELQMFSDLLVQIAELRKSIGGLQILDFAQESRKILSKLPMYFENEWRERVCSWRDKNGMNSYPPFDDLVKFIERRALRANIPELQGNSKSILVLRGKTGQQEKKNIGGVRSLKTNVTDSKAKEVETTPKCAYCSQEHHINDCLDFSKLTRENCLKFLKEKKLCFGCGSSTDHLASRCERRSKCGSCGKGHLTALHFDKPDNERFSRCTAICSMKDQDSALDNSMILPVWVRFKGNVEREILCYCILDDQSNTCFMSNKLRLELGLTGIETTLALSTMHKSRSYIQSKKVGNLEILSFDRQICMDLPAVFTRDHIPASRSQIPKPEVARKWKHLEGIANQMPPYQPFAEVALLLGNNVPRAIRPREIVAAGDDQPYAQRSILGWGIVGVVCQCSQENEIVSNRLSASCLNSYPLSDVSLSPVKRKIKVGDARFVCATKAKEIINPYEVRQIMEMDFVESKPSGKNCELSIEDRRFVEILSKNIERLDNGHYIMPLPLRSRQVALPNNRILATKRLLQLKNRFKRNAQFYQDYVEFMDEVVTKWAEIVPKDTLDRDDGKVNYVPHTGVYHPKKPGKIRVVFDCSASFQGVSLNDHLLRGPNLLNGLVGVLCRFRKERVALMADIQSMFHQFYVAEEDRDYLRFLWWEKGDTSRPLQEYRMKVHLFGAASSPGCANFGLKQAANDGEDEFGQAAADFVRNDFYVDDGLISLSSAKEVSHLVENSRALCAKGGLRLHKFLSNDSNVMDAIPESERAKGWKSLDTSSDPTVPLERALGVVWCIESDTFQFRIEIKDMPLTRRGILSTVSSVFDPCGYVAPVVIEGKKILQELCRFGVSWDDPIPDALASRWRKWRSQLPELENMQVQRCVKPHDFDQIKEVEMHHFSDACETGLGQCSYLRFVNNDDRVHCALVMGKARVAPLKQITIPRLELAAAVISAKMSKFLKEELNYPSIKEYFWVDSKVTLGYIRNEAKRFHVFVANRVQQIRDLSSPDAWLHVDSQSNPSDVASRGLSATNLSKSNWLHGPSFLWEAPGVWHDSTYDVNVKAEALIKDELRKVAVFSTCASNARRQEERMVTVLQSNVEKFAPVFDVNRLDGISDWFRAKRAIANCLLLKKKLAAKRTNNVYHGKLSMEMLGKAETNILKALQWQHFEEEIRTLQKLQDNGTNDTYDLNRSRVRTKNRSLKQVSSLYRLDVFIDEVGILRVGGRLRMSNLPNPQKHPIVIPKRSHVTNLLIDHHHKLVNHMGRGTTLSSLRQYGYWIIGGSSTVAQYIRSCILCKRMRGLQSTQKMSDLPPERIQEEPPFTYSGVDLFGPYDIKERRSVLKRYGVIFTCFASRAVHLETVNSLSTDAFINALRRFLARRGPIKVLRSDCGTNFVGAHNELLKSFNEMRQDSINNFLLQNDCDYVDHKFNFPHSSHMGGVWERLIRVTKECLHAVLHNAGTQLDDESFRTLLTEVESIVNSRPLSIENITDPEFPEPLTPNHILTMKPKVLLPPPGKFQQNDLYVHKRWRRVQHLANEFWYRWRREYIHHLQNRKKWTKQRRNLTIGDVVLLCEEGVPRNEWSLGKVHTVYPSCDGLVRKVKVMKGDRCLDCNGKRVNKTTYLDRPVSKLILLLPVADGDLDDMVQFPDEEPATTST